MTVLRTATAVWLAAVGLAVAQEQGGHGYLGVVTAPAPGDGERVVALDPQGPAAAAGLKVGDVLLKLDNQPLAPGSTLRAQMNAKKPSQVVALTFRDAAGAVQTKNVTLRERPALDPALPRSFYRPFDDVPGFADYVTQAQFAPPGPRPMLGVTVIDGDPDLRERLKLGNTPGVIISEVRPNTPAADAKLQVNDLVQAIDNKPVTNAGELQQIIGATKPDTQVKLKVLRGGQTVEVPVTVKSLPFPGMPTPRFPGMGMMGAGPNADLVNQINELRQRVQALEARVRQLESRGGAAPGAMGPAGGAPGPGAGAPVGAAPSTPPSPAGKGPPQPPRGTGSPPDR